MATVESLVSFFDTRYYQSACAGKQGYPTETSAETVRQMFASNRVRHCRAPGTGWQELEVYQCPVCGKFHLGH